MTFSLGRPAEQWNHIARVDRTVLGRVRNVHTERLCCQLLGYLDASELRVLLAIQARTLRFGKFAESISYDEFCRGLRNVDDELVVDDDNAPYFLGCNIAKAETVSHALGRLQDRGMITRWNIRHRWPDVFMPFTEEWLARELVYHRGAVAADYEYVVRGEYFQHGNGRYLRVDDVHDGGNVVLQPVNARFQYSSEPFEWSRTQWESARMERATVEQVLSARGHR